MTFRSTQPNFNIIQIRACNSLEMTIFYFEDNIMHLNGSVTKYRYQTMNLVTINAKVLISRQPSLE